MELSQDQLKVIAMTIAGILKDHFQVERPMRTKEAMQFLGIGKTLFHKLVNDGVIIAHRLTGEAHPSFLDRKWLTQLSAVSLPKVRYHD